MNSYKVSEFLNLRRQPVIEKGNVLGVMPPDTIVEEINGAPSGWMRVKTYLGSSLQEGYASKKYLDATTEVLMMPDPVPAIPLVHYPAGQRKIHPDKTGLWVYPLNDGVVQVNLTSIADAQLKQLHIHQVINSLDVERSARYAPNSKSTYCNIYAYDVTYCLGGYLPRVWWTTQAIQKLQQGQNLVPQYDKTVVEYTANRITDWFELYGSAFSWQRTFDLSELQTEVNKGTLGIIVAQRINMNNPGHIVAVVPETETAKASRNNNLVRSPLQSQAGSRNRKYFSGFNWWEDKQRFKKFGFWYWKIQ